MTTHILELAYPRNFHDGRNITDQVLDEIVKSDTKNTIYPVSLGHFSTVGFFGDGTPAAGTLSSLFRDDNGKLIGKVNLTEEVEADYQAGKYPGWSIGISRTEIPSKDNTADPEFTPWSMAHLAMLGAVPAAFKDVKEIKNHSNGDGEMKSMRRDDTEYMFFTMAGLPVEPKPTANQVTGKQAEKKMEVDLLKQNQEMGDRLAALEKEKANFAAMQKENNALSTRLETFEKREADRKALAFSDGVTRTVEAMAKLGVTETTQKAFSEAMETFKSHDMNALFSVLNSLCSEVRPSVPGGQFHSDSEPKTKSLESYSSAEMTSAFDGKGAN